MDEWQHNCARDGRVLLIPANECCDCCGMEPPGDHYFDRLERWLGFGAANAPADGVTEAPRRFDDDWAPNPNDDQGTPGVEGRTK